MLATPHPDNFVSRLLGKVLPMRLKRTLFLVTFTSYILDTDNPSQELANRINQLLSLGNSKSVVGPNIIQKHVWPKIIDKEQRIDENGICLKDLHEIADIKIFTKKSHHITNLIVQNTPSFMRYGSNRQMREDLMALFMNIVRVPQTA